MSAVLPYPDLDFVPLDILTAAEMNQLVANERYLANFWASPDSNSVIESNHIKNGAVSQKHVEFQEFPQIKFGSNKQLSFTVPADGVYIISCGVSLGMQSKTGEFGVELFVNGQKIDDAYFSPTTGVWWLVIQLGTHVKLLHSGDTITAQWSGVNEANPRGTSGLYITRII